MADPDPQTDDNLVPRKLPLSVLDEGHLTPIVRAISNVLSTDIAEATFAQIVDGLPLISVLWEAYGNPILDAKTHPIHNHTELCPGALERTKSFRSNFEPRDLQFDADLLMEYRAASPGSRSFKTLLIELIAVAVHQIAVLIIEADIGFHKDDGIASYEPPKEAQRWWRCYPDGMPPTLFINLWYLDYQQYPNGAADMVGYWAETRILGGVVLFNRHVPDSHDIFLHPDRFGFTYRIYQLVETQKNQLLDFLLSETPTPENCPLPILPSSENRNRVDPEEPIRLTGIFRNNWERNPRPEEFGDARSTTRHDILNYLTMQDWSEAQYRWRTKDERY